MSTRGVFLVECLGDMESVDFVGFEHLEGMRSALVPFGSNEFRVSFARTDYLPQTAWGEERSRQT